jgi:hypothetical protein
MKDITDLASDHYREELTKRGMSTHSGNVEAGGKAGMNKTQIYKAIDAGGENTRNPTMHERQLPGMGDPDAANTPKSWGDIPGAKQKDIAHRVAKQSGATMDSMTKAFGAQLDQGVYRAHRAGASKPYSRDFYTDDSPGTPGGVLRDTAKATGTSLGMVAAVNADTSPQMKFSTKNKSGQQVFPNAEKAAHIIAHVKGGGNADNYSNDSEHAGYSLEGPSRTGFNKNAKKAVDRVSQVASGTPLAQTAPMGPKTGPYNNSWLPDHPDFFVSDVHSGGGGFLPHQSSEKKIVRDARGNPVKTKSGDDRTEKSERENTIDVAGFHSMGDHAARAALAERGLGRVRQSQATQWGEERIQRGDQGIKHADAYPAAAPKPQSPGQGSLFPAHPTVGNNLNAGQFGGTK